MSAIFNSWPVLPHLYSYLLSGIEVHFFASLVSGEYYGLHFVPQNSYVETPVPSTSESDCLEKEPLKR